MSPDEILKASSKAFIISLLMMACKRRFRICDSLNISHRLSLLFPSKLYEINAALQLINFKNINEIDI